MPKLATVALAIIMLAAGTPAHAGENETFAAAQDFILSLTELEAAQQRYYDLAKTAQITSYEASPLCDALNPDPEVVADEPASLSELLKKAKISAADARVLCGALAAERASVEKAKGANLTAASACAAYRVPACDIANEVVAAQRESRERLRLGGQQ